ALLLLPARGGAAFSALCWILERTGAGCDAARGTDGRAATTRRGRDRRPARRRGDRRRGGGAGDPSRKGAAMGVCGLRTCGGASRGSVAADAAGKPGDPEGWIRTGL